MLVKVTEPTVNPSNEIEQISSIAWRGQSKLSTAQLDDRITNRFVVRMIVNVVAAFCLVFFLVTTYMIQADKKAFSDSATALSRSIATSLWHYDLASIKSGAAGFAFIWGEGTIGILDSYQSLVAGTTVNGEVSHRFDIFVDDHRKVGELIAYYPGSKHLNPEIFRVGLYCLLGAFCLSGLIARQFVLFARSEIISPLWELASTLSQHSGIRPDGSMTGERPRELPALQRLLKQQFLCMREREQELEGTLQRRKALLQHHLDIVTRQEMTYVLTDEKGNLVDAQLRDPFDPEQLSQLLSFTNMLLSGLTPVELNIGDVSIIGKPIKNDTVTKIELALNDGEVLTAQIFELGDGCGLLMIDSRVDDVWSSIFLHEFLSGVGGGLTIFNPRGRKYLETGSLLADVVGVDHTTVYFSDFLFRLPPIGSMTASEPFSFDFKSASGRTYRLKLLKNMHGWIGVSHQDLTEERNKESQVRSAQRMVEIGQFSSGIAHNFNNSLGVVVGQLELMKMEVHSARLREQIDTAMASAEQASGIVSQLLAFTKQENLVRSAMSVDDLIRKNESILRSAVTEKHLLKLQLNSSAIAKIDAPRFMSAVMNLAINAREAMPQSGVVTISTRVVPDANTDTKNLVIEIADQGTGIPPVAQLHIFEPFYTSKAESGGTGLGLASVKGIIEHLDGTIEFDTGTTGTTFRITLKDVHLQAIDNGHQRRLVSSNDEHSSNTHEIIVIDDDDMVRGTQRQLIEVIHPNVESFKEGRLAIKYAERNPNVRTAFIDLQMPVMNGVEVAAALLKVRPDMRILILSGDVSRVETHKLTEMGVDRCLSKPVSLKTLRAIIQLRSKGAVETNHINSSGARTDKSTDSITRPFNT